MLQNTFPFVCRHYEGSYSKISVIRFVVPVCFASGLLQGEGGVAGPRAARDGGRVWANGSGVRREGRGVWGWVFLRCVGVRVRLQRRARVVSCRPRDLEEKPAVFCGRGMDFTDECAYLVHLLVGGGKRVL